MSIFKDIINAWKSDDLLSQAWEESFSMLILSHKIFQKSVNYLNSGIDIESVKELKRRDIAINDYHKSVRRKLVTHFSMGENTKDIASGFILAEMAVEIERIGDYCKNISDITLTRKSKVNFNSLAAKIKDVEEEVLKRFKETIEAIDSQDQIIATDIVKSYKPYVAKISDDIVHDIISKTTKVKSDSDAASIVLYARYLKRIGAHLKNITTTVINPYDKVGYQNDLNLL